MSLFFAVWGNDDEDAGLFIIRRPDEVSELRSDPFHVSRVHFFYPGYVTPRLVSQRGLFTVHPEPAKPYTADDMQQVVIGKACKPDFRRKLDSSGVHHAAIFADLDGLSRRLVALQGYRRTGMEAGPPGPGVGATTSIAAAPTSSAIARAKAMKRRKTKQPSELPASKINPRDPQKGQWGGLPKRNNWELTAKIDTIADDWFDIDLTVKAVSGAGKTLRGDVTFYLHDTFATPVCREKASGGKAELNVQAYGAFTVGVLIESDGTMLELDLADVKSAPKKFREQ